MNKQMAGYLRGYNSDKAEQVIIQCTTLDRSYWIVTKCSHAVSTDTLLFYADINAEIWQLECVVQLSYEAIYKVI